MNKLVYETHPLLCIKYESVLETQYVICAKNESVRENQFVNYIMSESVHETQFVLCITNKSVHEKRCLWHWFNVHSGVTSTLTRFESWSCIRSCENILIVLVYIVTILASHFKNILCNSVLFCSLYFYILISYQLFNFSFVLTIIF